MHHIFICHAKEDDVFASRLAADLKGNNQKTWVDHEDIPQGADWDSAITAGIEQSDTLLLIVTRASLESAVCNDEWNHALTMGKVVIPIMVGANIMTTDLPIRLKRRQWVDFRGDYDEALQKLKLSLGMEGKTTLLKPPPNLPGETAPSHQGVPPSMLAPTAARLTLPMLQWCEIPIGETVINNQSVPVNTFLMSRFPITVIQYEFFVEEDGYNNREYWTEAGFAWKTRENITQPSHWHDSHFHALYYPVVGVSWYEAIAFCNWLSDKSARTITLPTEQQWQRAAQGDDNRVYPWGNTFDSAYCNTEESGIGGTQPVDHYPNGVSIYGVAELSGNVWEWCLNTWDENAPGAVDLASESARVMRGGSWYTNQEKAKTTTRHHNLPHVRDEGSGFRVVINNGE